MDRHANNPPLAGKVYLVGAGPGDPDLLTIKAMRLLANADVVIYDRLVSDDILELLPPTAERIFVGKSPSHHTLKQHELNKLLVKRGRTGDAVIVRLKGGDPFIFGRGGEEALALAQAGVPFEVIPGITAASGCASYAGIPLTHRGMASGVRFVTGHCRNDWELDLNWNSLADEDTTLVFYMPLINIKSIKTKLLSAGMNPLIPAAIICEGTTAQQIVRAGTLSSLVELADGFQPPTPCLILIGNVVRLSEQLAWWKEHDGACDDELVMFHA